MCKHIAGTTVCKRLFSESYSSLIFRALQHCWPKGLLKPVSATFAPPLLLASTEETLKAVVLYQIQRIRRYCLGKEPPLQLSFLLLLPRFAGFDEWDNQGEKWEACHPASKSTLSFSLASFNSVKSKTLSVALPCCHNSFHYLPDCRDRGDNGYWVDAILHPHLEVTKTGKQLSVI